MEDRTMAERINDINLRASAGYNPYIAQEISRAQIRCREAEIKAQIKIDAEEMKGKVLADIAARKELQKTRIHVTVGQNVVISKERFGEDLTDVVPFVIKGCETFIRLEKDTDKLLHVRVLTKRVEKSVFFCYMRMDDMYINRKFNAAGVAFGFSHEKETRMRKLLLTELIDMAPLCFLPERHGWYKQEGVIGFAFPEMKTWEEFAKFV